MTNDYTIQEQLGDIAEAVSHLTIRAEQDEEREAMWGYELSGEEAAYLDFLEGYHLN